MQIVRPSSRILVPSVCVLLLILAGAGARGDFLVTSALTDSIVRFSDSGGLRGDFITPASGGLNAPFAMEYGPDGQTLYVGGGGAIWYYNRFTGAPLGKLSVPAANYDGLSFAPNGDLFAASLNERVLYRFNSTTGATIARFTTPELDNPNHLLQLPDGRLLVTAKSTVYTIDMNQNAINGTFAQVGAGSQLMGMQLGPDGYLYVADAGRSKGIYRLDPSTGANLGTFITPAAGYYADLVFVSGNRLWADQLLSGTLDRFDATTGDYVDSFSSPPDSWDMLHMPEPGTATVMLFIGGGLLLGRQRVR